MNINSNAVLDRIEVGFYSILTFCLSWVYHIQGHLTRMEKSQQYPLNFDEVDTYLISRDISEKTPNIIWTSISQAFVTITIWMILGFAAGFLIGIIEPK